MLDCEAVHRLTPNGGVAITPVEAAENPTHAQWLANHCQRKAEKCRTIG
jgi:hypothetical protein